MSDLSGTVTIVTGGAGRLGGAIVARLLSAGGKVAAFDLAPPDRPARDGLLWLAADVTDPASVRTAFDEAERALGPIDGLVNAHGIDPNVQLVDMTLEDWDLPFRVNTLGTALTMQAAARRWIARGAPGAIVNLSSGAAPSPRSGGAHYAASKAAVDALTAGAAIELGPHGIRVNALAPGLVLDPASDGPEKYAHPYVEFTRRSTPLGRLGVPDDIASAVLFLLSGSASWITGSVVQIDGGQNSGRTLAPITGKDL